MSYVFISHSSRNDFEAIAIKDWLTNAGWDDLFLDLDPERGIVAGERWERALHEAASRCDAILFLVSQHWLDSEWCRKEFRLAHRLNKRIIGLLIEDLDVQTLPEELTSTWQMVRLASGTDHKILRVTHPTTGQEQHVHFSQAGLTRLKTGLVKAGLDPRYFEWPPANDADRPPYRGLQPLEADDAGIFFGREAPIIDLLARLRGYREETGIHFLAILGASGAGKSSFLRAGILPRLARDERNFITLPIVRPGHSVLWGDDGLLKSLTSTFSRYKIGINRTEVRRAIESDHPKVIELLKQVGGNAASNLTTIGEYDDGSAKPLTLILAVDQGEELFQSEGSKESLVFLELLKRLASESGLSLVIVFTIRSNAYEQLQTTKTLDGIAQQTFSLAPMPHGAYQSIIEGPANRLKETSRPLKVDANLTERLLADIERGGSKDALPLLAFTLERLYLDYGDDGDLRLDEYEDMGGIEGAIEAAVELCFKKGLQDPSLPNDRDAIKALLRRGLIPWLAGIDPDTQAPRRRVAKLSEIPDEARSIISHLIEQRLLATDIEEETGETTLEPAHESLLRQWGLLQGWLEEDFAALATLEGLQRASRDWVANERGQDWLNHTSGRLEDAELLKQREDLSRFLTSSDWDYLKVCREMENNIRHKELMEAKKLAEAQQLIVQRTEMGDELINFMLFDLKRELQPLGRIDILRSIAERVFDYFKNIDKETASPQTLMMLCHSHSNIGDIFKATGDLSGALEYKRLSLDIAQFLVEQDPSHTAWQSNLSDCYSNVGDILEARGFLDGALKQYQLSLGIRKQLNAQDPSHYGLQKNLAASYDKIAHILKQLSELSGALEQYQLSLGIRKKLAEQHPNNSEYQSYLSDGYNNIGNILRYSGDLNGALEQYHLSLSIRKKLVEQHPCYTELKSYLSDSDNSDDKLAQLMLAEYAGCQRDLAASYNNVGDILKARGDLDEALEKYELSEGICYDLVRTDPSNAEWQSDLSVSTKNTTDLRKARSDLKGASNIMLKKKALKFTSLFKK
jgi:tetratricopeptide (TPR) repeat protein